MENNQPNDIKIVKSVLDEYPEPSKIKNFLGVVVPAWIAVGLYLIASVCTWVRYSPQSIEAGIYILLVILSLLLPAGLFLMVAYKYHLKQVGTLLYACMMLILPAYRFGNMVTVPNGYVFFLWLTCILAIIETVIGYKSFFISILFIFLSVMMAFFNSAWTNDVTFAFIGDIFFFFSFVMFSFFNKLPVVIYNPPEVALERLEKKHARGKISEDKYKMKRTEILKKL
ncbi:MAG: SHOCT domain-containing protein [Lachnospiraceae bacterium]|nr:SHOCT domain-containing protein [Lachnospiraceae bacterium]